MSKRDTFLDRLAVDRRWRLGELSILRDLFDEQTNDVRRDCVGRSMAVLCYAHWEGFFASCADVFSDYIDVVRMSKKKMAAGIRLGFAAPHFDSFVDKKDNVENRLTLLKAIESMSVPNSEKFQRSLLLPKSNLNFLKLRSIADILESDVTPFQPYRLRIDLELVQWRHQIAHGEGLVMDKDLVTGHSHFCEDMMLLVQDMFEAQIFKY